MPKAPRGRRPAPISPPVAYPVIQLRTSIEITPHDIIEIARTAKLNVTQDAGIRAQAAADLSYALDEYVFRSMTMAKGAPRGSPQAWAKAIVRVSRDLIQLLGGNADAPLSIDRNNAAAANLARVLPIMEDQPDLWRTLRYLQAMAGTSSAGSYGALVSTIHCTREGAAAILLLAEQLRKQPALPSIHDGKLKAGLFVALRPIFEQLHPGHRFSRSNLRPNQRTETKASGPTFRWSLAVLQLAATRFGNVPELAELNRWAEAHPDGVAERIRNAARHGETVTN